MVFRWGDSLARNKALPFTTEKDVYALPLPTRGRTLAQHTKVRELFVFLTPTARTAYRVGRIDGKPEQHKIGRFPPLKLEQAIREVRRLNGQVAERHNPADERRQERKQ